MKQSFHEFEFGLKIEFATVCEMVINIFPPFVISYEAVTFSAQFALKAIKNIVANVQPRFVGGR